jgi:hypothetical protein
MTRRTTARRTGLLQLVEQVPVHAAFREAFAGSCVNTGTAKPSAWC